MKTVVTAGDMRRLEQAAVDAGASYETLLLRAGTAAAKEYCAAFGSDGQTALILCGNGNNGGDGFVIAEYLCENTAADVTVLLMCGEPKTALASKIMKRLTHTRATILTLPEDEDDIVALFSDPRIASADHVVDAVYGIGFRGRLPRAVREVFRILAQRQLPVLAVDIPSGVHADSGFFDRDTLKADLTVTFTAKKPSMANETVCGLCGKVIVADVGISAELTAQYQTNVCCLSPDLIGAAFSVRPADGHKGTFGKMLSVCGSYGMAGAAMLSGKAALRCGVGLLHMALPRSIYPIVASQLWEAVYHPIGEGDTLTADALESLTTLGSACSSVLVGCGLSQDEKVQSLLKSWLPTVSVPMVIDADGLNVFASHIDMWKAIHAPCVITPHPAEAARLLGITVEDVERDRIAAAKRLCVLTGAVTVLKGHKTVIVLPGGDVLINTTGCSGMATGGSGDVLGGMIASFLAQGMSVADAALAGVCIHGQAGEAAAKRLGETAMLPTDMIDELPLLLSHYEKRE